MLTKWPTMKLKRADVVVNYTRIENQCWRENFEMRKFEKKIYKFCNKITFETAKKALKFMTFFPGILTNSFKNKIHYSTTLISRDVKRANYRSFSTLISKSHDDAAHFNDLIVIL